MRAITNRDPEAARNARKLDAILERFNMPRLPSAGRAPCRPQCVCWPTRHHDRGDRGLSSDSGASLGEAKVTVADALRAEPPAGLSLRPCQTPDQAPEKQRPRASEAWAGGWGTRIRT